jgi:hypothetical protein
MKQFWKSMLRSPSGVIGLIILLLAISVALFGPMLFPNSPWRMVQRPFLPPFTLATVPLGTDALGRDVFAGMIFGARVSLLVGMVSTLVALVVGVPIGAMAGYFGGRVDDALMRFTEFFQTIPSFALAIVLVAILQPSIYSIVASIAVVSWPQVARLTRGEPNPVELLDRDDELDVPHARPRSGGGGACLVGHLLETQDLLDSTGYWVWGSLPSGAGYSSVSVTCGPDDDPGTPSQCEVHGGVLGLNFPNLVVTIAANGTTYTREYSWSQF